MKNLRKYLVIFAFIIQNCSSAISSEPAYLDTTLSIDYRVADLVSRMTLEEKISQLSHFAPGIERLNVRPYQPIFENPFGEVILDRSKEEALKEYNDETLWKNPDKELQEAKYMDGGYWNEALHGVARSGLATSFPQSIGLGASWNPNLVEKMANVIGIEARVHNNVYGKKLTFWSPTINILRDPRWGRSEESYSEDPYLLSRMAVAFVSGLQGNDSKYLQAVATVKHFVANNSEFNRHTGSSNLSERFLREYYLPAFEAAIIEGNAMSIMTAYNAINGVPASANTWLLDSILRKEWGFKGYVVSDCGAISDISNTHKYEEDKEKAIAMAVIAGTDLECETCETQEFMYDTYLPGALEKGYITEIQIDIAVRRLFRARMLLGEFDPPTQVPFTSIPEDKLDCQEHRDLALQLARETIVLLKNARLPGQENNTLPLNKGKLKEVAVIGPNANVAELGGYSGEPAILISPLQGIREYLYGEVNVQYHKGCNITNNPNKQQWGELIHESEVKEEIEEEVATDFIEDEEKSIQEAAELAKKSDVVILVLGTNLEIANEAADRKDLNLPGSQIQLAQAVYKANPNTVVVLINGMTLDISWLDDNVPAILEAWYPGQAGGTAIAETLFGDNNPGGKLPITFHKGIDNLPDIAEYDISKGHSYWFFNDEVLYPFGYGLSYTTFKYSNLKINTNKISATTNNEIIVECTIQNTGFLKGDEVVQLYVKDLKSSVIQPLKELRKFKRITLDKGETQSVSFTLNNRDFSYWDENLKDWTIEAGEFEIQVGTSSIDIKLNQIIKAL